MRWWKRRAATHTIAAPLGLLPNAFISDDPELSALLELIWQRPRMEAARARMPALTGGEIGTSLWYRVP